MSYQPQGQGTASLGDVTSQLQNIARQFGLWIAAFKGRITFGSFTMPAAATATISQPAAQANSNISLTATNAAAGTLQGSAKHLYISSISPGVSFTVATASGGNAAGTETLNYLVSTPS